MTTSQDLVMWTSCQIVALHCGMIGKRERRNVTSMYCLLATHVLCSYASPQTCCYSICRAAQDADSSVGLAARSLPTEAAVRWS
jgi:hypothetical protein